MGSLRIQAASILNNNIFNGKTNESDKFTRETSY